MKTTKKKKVIMLGGGGHARVLKDILDQDRTLQILGFTDVTPRRDLAAKYLGDDRTLEKYKPQQVWLVNGLGSIRLPQARQKIFEDFKAKGYRFLSVIHPRAVISRTARLGEGVQVMAQAVINSGAHIGDDVIINTSSSIDHDCRIGAHTHIAPGVTLSGNVTISTTCHIGTGAVVIQNITIGESVLVAAGETVRKDCPAGSMVFPKKIRNK